MSAPAAPVSNIPEFSVAEFSAMVKATLEGEFGRIRVRGEITEARPYSSGHIYFSLKEDRCKLACVAWASVVARLSVLPENGMEVIATGKISAYGDRSSYQMLVDGLEPAGDGALLARVEMLRRRLAAEGLFDAARKRPLPGLPETIGVVTSEAGAVLHDIRTTINRRFPRRVLVWPVPVQGEGAAERIAAAIAGFSHAPFDAAVPRPEVLIVARGGGSLEDLMAFNDEAVVRAAAASTIPIVSAIGHETDTTLLDYAADRRAPTPTAAAELIVPSRVDLLGQVARFEASLHSCIRSHLRHHLTDLARIARGLPDLPGMLGNNRQRLDDRGERLDLVLPALVAARAADLARIVAAAARFPATIERGRFLLGALWQETAQLAAQRLGAARDTVSSRAAEMGSAAVRLIAARSNAAHRIFGRSGPAPLAGALREAAARLDSSAARLDSVSHRAVLARGYAVVFDLAGRTLARRDQVPAGARLRIAFADGDVMARAAPASKPSESQPSLL